MNTETTTEVTRFIEKEKDFLWSRAMSLTHKSEDAEDLYQDTVMKIYQGWDSFDIETNFRAWANRIMLNTHLNNVSRTHDHLSYDFNSGASENTLYHIADMDETSYAISPEKIFFLHHIDKRIIEALYTLPDEFRKSFSLFHFEGYSYEEIAEMLGMPIGTIKSRIFRARKMLKELVGQALAERKAS